MCLELYVDMCLCLTPLLSMLELSVYVNVSVCIYVVFEGVIPYVGSCLCNCIFVV